MAMAIDESGNILVTGNTASSDFPLSPGAYDTTFNGGSPHGDVFVSKLDNNLSLLYKSTYLGGSSDERGTSLDLDSRGNIYVVGYTKSTNYPTLSGSYDTLYNGGSSDIFVSKHTFSRFSRIWYGDPVIDGGNSWGCSWIDYDNDDAPDLFVTNTDDDNHMYHNNGDDTFTKVTGDIIGDDYVSGIASAGVSWADFDNDGDIDALVATFKEFSPPVNYLYSNDGTGSFTKATTGALIGDPGMSICPTWGDYDNDGDLDLYVANHNEGNYLYQQDDTGYVRVMDGAVVTDNSHSNFAGWADIDNDGDLDLYVANAWDDQADCLYENNGSGGFAKVTTGDIISGGYDSFGGSWADFDNDGDLDLFITHVMWGDPSSSANFLYQNDGTGNFTSVTGQGIVNDGAYSYGSAWGDYDNDGDLDLYVANTGVNFLYENPASRMAKW
jgi:hypothetical protein